MKTILLASFMASSMSGDDANLMRYIHETSAVNPQSTAVIYSYMQEYNHVCNKSPTLNSVKRFETYVTFQQLSSPSNEKQSLGVHTLQTVLAENYEKIICE